MNKNEMSDGYHCEVKDGEHRPDLSCGEYDGKFERAERKMELEKLLHLKRKDLPFDHPDFVVDLETNSMEEVLERLERTTAELTSTLHALMNLIEMLTDNLVDANNIYDGEKNKKIEELEERLEDYTEGRAYTKQYW